MKNTTSILLFFVFVVFTTYGQVSIVKTDNDIAGGFYSGTKYLSWEESACLKPAGPCQIKAVHIYLSGSAPKKDSIQILQDPTDGGIPPTRFVWKYGQRCPAVEFNYSGTPGWMVIDVSNLGLHFDGFDRIVVQHVIPSAGPYFTFDSDEASSPLTSYLCDALTPNPKFSNIRGTIFYKAAGDFMVRLEVEYDFPLADGSASPPFPGMYDVTKAAGLTDGSGNPLKNALVSVADWNYDGLDDVAIGNIFYQNNGDGTFKNVSQSNVIAGSTVWADYNNDGKMDFFANNGGMPSDKVYDQIYTGRGDGTYTPDEYGDVTLEYPTVSPMWLDFDADGLLDIFIAYGRKTVGSAEQYFPDQLFRNRGNGRFDNVTIKSKIGQGEPSPYFDCWGASICDYNNDMLPDVFVATYRLAPDKLYKNMGDGTFQDVSKITGVQGVPTNSPNYFGHGMGSDWCDFNNDGFTDLAVGNLGHPDERGLSSNPSLIFRNQGPPDYKFGEVHQEMGLKFFEMNAGIVWADFNLDSYSDLFHCQYSYEQKGKEQDRLSRLYINSGPGSDFRLLDKTWEFGCLVHGAWSPVTLDYDNDGDMDLIVASSNEYLKLFRNDLQVKGNWISFRLRGNPNANINADALGSSVTVYAGGLAFYRQLPGTKLTARASQSTNELNFGLGNITKIDSVLIRFGKNMSVVINNIEINRKYIVTPDGDVFSTGRAAAPMLVYPANHSELEVANPNLVWTLSGNTKSYEIQISGHGDMSNIIESSELTGNSYKAMLLEPNTQYYWRVKAIPFGKDEAALSSVWAFKTGAVTIAADDNDNQSIELEVNPNPVSYVAEIAIDLPCAAGVSLDVFDLTGNKVTNLIDSELRGGRNSIYWETGDISTGVYYLVLSVNNFKTAKRVFIYK